MRSRRYALRKTRIDDEKPEEDVDFVSAMSDVDTARRPGNDGESCGGDFSFGDDDDDDQATTSTKSEEE